MTDQDQATAPWSPQPRTGADGGAGREQDFDLPLSLRTARWIAITQAGIGIAAVVGVMLVGLSLAGDLGGAPVLALLLGSAAGLVLPVAILAVALALDGLDRWVRNALIGIELVLLVLGIAAEGTDLGPLALLGLPLIAGAATVIGCLLMPAARSACAGGDDDEDEVAWPVAPAAAPMATAGDTSWRDLVDYWKGLLTRR